jgi:light-regulated signal transduction histidine kinase (bacteriophytochrome)
MAEGRRGLSGEAAELSRANAELEQFAYVASHDLQEPLRKIASFTQILEQRYGEQLDERAKQYIGFAVDGAKRMQRLINDLLDFSRVGRVGGERARVDCAEALATALVNLSAQIEDAEADVAAHDMPVVVGNRLLLTQLFQNIVGNALKFRSEEPPRLRITARRDGPMWEFSCTDNGIGIASKHADRIFLIFQRLHPRDVYPGTGIGLALCKKIVEYHGGEIWVDPRSEPGSGTTFRWTLPAAGGESD